MFKRKDVRQKQEGASQPAYQEKKYSRNTPNPGQGQNKPMWKSFHAHQNQKRYFQDDSQFQQKNHEDHEYEDEYGYEDVVVQEEADYIDDGYRHGPGKGYKYDSVIDQGYSNIGGGKYTKSPAQQKSRNIAYSRGAAYRTQQQQQQQQYNKQYPSRHYFKDSQEQHQYDDRGGEEEHYDEYNYEEALYGDEQQYQQYQRPQKRQQSDFMYQGQTLEREDLFQQQAQYKQRRKQQVQILEMDLAKENPGIAKGKNDGGRSHRQVYQRGLPREASDRVEKLEDKEEIIENWRSTLMYKKKEPQLEEKSEPLKLKETTSAPPKAKIEEVKQQQHKQQQQQQNSKMLDLDPKILNRNAPEFKLEKRLSDPAELALGQKSHSTFSQPLPMLEQKILSVGSSEFKPIQAKPSPQLNYHASEFVPELRFSPLQLQQEQLRLYQNQLLIQHQQQQQFLMMQMERQQQPSLKVDAEVFVPMVSKFEYQDNSVFSTDMVQFFPNQKPPHHIWEQNPEGESQAFLNPGSQEFIPISKLNGGYF